MDYGYVNNQRYTYFRGLSVLSPTYATAAKCITASNAFSENILFSYNYFVKEARHIRCTIVCMISEWKFNPICL